MYFYIHLIERESLFLRIIIDVKKMSFVDMTLDETLTLKIEEFVKKILDKKGVIKRGIMETSKALERGFAKLVLLPESIENVDLIKHLPKMAQEKKVPYAFVQGFKREELQYDKKTKQQLYEDDKKTVPKKETIEYSAAAGLGKICRIGIECSAVAITQIPKEVENDFKDLVKLISDRRTAPK
jgi:ribosomal protein L7Ae-like RNA K-turn-binding protein